MENWIIFEYSCCCWFSLLFCLFETFCSVFIRIVLRYVHAWMHFVWIETYGLSMKPTPKTHSFTLSLSPFLLPSCLIFTRKKNGFPSPSSEKLSINKISNIQIEYTKLKTMQSALSASISSQIDLINLPNENIFRFSTWKSSLSQHYKAGIWILFDRFGRIFGFFLYEFPAENLRKTKFTHWVNSNFVKNYQQSKCVYRLFIAFVIWLIWKCRG